MKNLNLLLFTFLLGSSASSVQVHASTPSFKKVMIVVFENADYDQVVQQPFFSKFAASGALMRNFHAETHPSQANYIALISGASQGVQGDAPVDLDGKHIGDLLEAQGKSWKVYAEGYPGNCYTGKRSGAYVRKHNPFHCCPVRLNKPEAQLG